MIDNGPINPDGTPEVDCEANRMRLESEFDDMAIQYPPTHVISSRGREYHASGLADAAYVRDTVGGDINPFAFD
jgi:hypothetical protein